MAKVSLRAYNREIETMVDRGQLDEAIAHCQHILKTFPKHLETYRLLGKAFLEYKRHNDAVDIFSRVLASEPNDFVANVGMSIIRDEENKLDDAIWHMERAFEVQPSNAAIQGELQRLYGRREGVQPSRIRMTRGALAHMYVQGELYPQAISEIKSVLQEDLGRSDMQVLLARAYYRSGQKTQAADEASAVLRRYPYCLDANRVLVEILSADRPENAQVYRQRVIELDPYAAQVSGTIFQTSEVGDAAVTIEHLEWSGQAVGMQPDWRSTGALTLESETGRGTQGTQEQPDWLKSGFMDSTPQATPKVVPPLPASTPSFDTPAQSRPAQPTPAEDIPEFLRAAGWGESTGTFDESKLSFAGEPEASASSAEPIAQGDLPDWVKAMAPPAETLQPDQPAEEEVLPDWINKIGTGGLAATAISSSSNAPDWLTGSDEPVAPQPAADDQLDWMKNIEQPSVSQAPVTDQPDWMRGLDQPAASQSAADNQPDWMRGLDQSVAPQSVADDQPDWMKGLDQPTSLQSVAGDVPDWMMGIDQPAASQPVADNQPDWMKGIEQPAPSQSSADDAPDWMKSIEQPTASEPVAEDQPDWMKGFDQPEPTQPAGNEELDWLKGLGEDVESSPITSAVEQPDWLTQFGDQPAESAPASAPAGNEFDFLNELSEQPQATTTASVPSAIDTGNLGVSEQERDDSFAWLENLAAKQGASEGLLTKPEDRREEEPEWVKQAKGATSTEKTPVSESSVQPAANVEELGKSDQERDDSFAWLENLAAKQGATEGLLTKPEERLEKEPDWVQQAKGAPQVPSMAQQPPANVEELGKSEQERDDSFAWLENLAAKQGATEGLLTKPEERMEQEPEWVQQAKSAPQTPAQPPANVEELGKSDQERDDSFAWLENLAAKQGATEGLLTKPEDRLEQEPEWVQQAKSAPQTPASGQQPPADAAELGKSEQERDDSFAWLENLAAKQGATEGLLTKPEDRLEQEPEWVQQAKNLPQTPVEEPTPEQTPSADDTRIWLRGLEAEESTVEPASRNDETAIWLKKLDEPKEPIATPEAAPVDDTRMWLRGLEAEESTAEPASRNDETAMWFRKLDEPEEPASTSEAAPVDDMPAWLQGLDQEEEVPSAVAEAVVPAKEADDELAWLNPVEEPAAPQEVALQDENLPSWLQGMEAEPRLSEVLPQDDLPAWMRDDTGEILAEPTKIEPTRPTEWQPVTEQQPEPSAPPPVEEVRSQPEPAAEPIEPAVIKPAPVKKTAAKSATEVRPATPPPPYREPVTQRGTGMLTMPIDPMLGSARNELSRSNIPGALEAYGKLIKKGRFLDEVIFDLREALYRYPVEVSIWQSLGDAYMRANRLQDALDAYTKAEELLR